MDYRFRRFINDIEINSYTRMAEIISTIPKDKLIDCSYGINPFGFSEKAKQKLSRLSNSDVFEMINAYGDPIASPMLEAVAKRYQAFGITKHNVRMSSGSINALDRIAHLFLDEGTKVLGPIPQFGDFFSVIKSYGGLHCPVYLKEQQNYRFDVEEFLNEITGEHSLIYIDNPNNPTGQIIAIEDIVEIAKKAKLFDTTVLIDEAYGDFMPEINSAISIVNDFDNVVVTKSLSKGLGLAGIRCGFLVANSEFLQKYDTVDVPFSIPRLHYEIITEAIFDREFLIDCVKKIEMLKKEFLGSLKNLYVFETDNTVPIMTVCSRDKDIDLFEQLAKRNINTEPSFGFPGMPKNAVRLRVPTDVSRLIEAIGDLI